MHPKSCCLHLMPHNDRLPIDFSCTIYNSLESIFAYKFKVAIQFCLKVSIELVRYEHSDSHWPCDYQLWARISSVSNQWQLSWALQATSEFDYRQVRRNLVFGFEVNKNYLRWEGLKVTISIIQAFHSSGNWDSSAATWIWQKSTITWFSWKQLNMTIRELKMQFGISVISDLFPNSEQTKSEDWLEWSNSPKMVQSHWPTQNVNWKFYEKSWLISLLPSQCHFLLISKLLASPMTTLHLLDVSTVECSAKKARDVRDHLKALMLLLTEILLQCTGLWSQSCNIRLAKRLRKECTMSAYAEYRKKLGFIKITRIVICVRRGCSSKVVWNFLFCDCITSRGKNSNKDFEDHEILFYSI